MKDLLLIGGVLLVGLVVLKSGILNSLPTLGEDPTLAEEEFLEGEEGLEMDLDGDGIPDTRSPNTIASGTLSSPLKAVNYYAGKIAGMIASMASRNIYDATQIKEYLIDRRVAEVEHIAQLVNYKIVQIDYTNIVALRELARLALDVSKELRIEFTVDDALALEVLGNVGRGYSALPPSSRNEMVLGNVSRYILDRFNGAPAIRIPNDEAMIQAQVQAFEGPGPGDDEDDGDERSDRKDRDDDDDDDDKKKRKKKGNMVKAYFGNRHYPYFTPSQYYDFNSAYELPTNRYYPHIISNPFTLRRRRIYQRPRPRPFLPWYKKYNYYNRGRPNYWW